MACMILDVLLRLAIDGEWQCLHECLDILPKVALVELVAYAKSHPEPRLFSLTPGTAEIRREQREAEKKAVGLQVELLKALQSRLA